MKYAFATCAVVFGLAFVAVSAISSGLYPPRPDASSPASVTGTRQLKFSHT